MATFFVKPNDVIIIGIQSIVKPKKFVIKRMSTEPYVCLQEAEIDEDELEIEYKKFLSQQKHNIICKKCKHTAYHNPSSAYKIDRLACSNCEYQGEFVYID